MKLDILVTKHNEAVRCIDDNGLSTKEQLKSFVANVNRIIDLKLSQVARDARIALKNADKKQQDSYFDLSCSLPYTVYVHQHKGALAKFEKASKKDPRFLPHYEALLSVSEYVQQAQYVKTLEIAPRETASEKERKNQEARWKTLPNASKAVVDAIMDAVTPEVSKHHAKRIEMVAELRNSYKKEISAAKDGKGKFQVKQNAIAKYGIGVLSLITAPVEDADAILVRERASELEKVRISATKRLGTYEVDKSSVTVETGLDGIECQFTLYNNGETVGNFGFKAILAGGYNIQRLHLRTIFNEASA
jgi:hypothetical protein